VHQILSAYLSCTNAEFRIPWIPRYSDIPRPQSQQVGSKFPFVRRCVFFLAITRCIVWAKFFFCQIAEMMRGLCADCVQLWTSCEAPRNFLLNPFIRLQNPFVSRSPGVLDGSFDYSLTAACVKFHNPTSGSSAESLALSFLPLANPLAKKRLRLPRNCWTTKTKNGERTAISR